MSKLFEVWSEGYAVTGNEAGAHLHGAAPSDTFAGACRQVFAGDRYFDAERMTYWGCRLHDNEADARKGFG